MDINPQQVPMHIEIQQSNEQAEKRVASILIPLYRTMGESEDFLKNGLRVKQVESNVFTVGTDRIVSMFCNERGEVLMNANALREAYYFRQAGYLAGFREIPSKTEPVNLYRIQDIDNQGNPLPEAKPLDKYSKEYYQAFRDISFYDDRLILETYKKPDAVDKPTPESQRTFTNMDDKLLLSFANGVMKIRDLVQLKEHKQVSDNGYQSALAILQKNLLDTIGDYRFERINQQVTWEELNSYLSYGLIDGELYKRAIAKLEQVERAKWLKERKHSEVTNNTKEQVSGLLEENRSMV